MSRLDIQRCIIHVDMDAFFASVEIGDNPQLRHKPVIVGGTGTRGVVCAASYEARKYGVHSAMPLKQAYRLCPDGIFLPVRMDRYQEISAKIFRCFYSITPLVEGLSVDEAFLDVTGALRLHGDFLSIGCKIKRIIFEKTGLVASVGLAHNKYLAKIASDLDKPDGFFYMNPENLQTILDPLSVTRVWGVGPKAAEKLSFAGIKTIKDLRSANRKVLTSIFKNRADHFIELANGIDTRPLEIKIKDKSISNEQTFSEDLYILEDMHAHLLYLSEMVAWRLRQQNLKGYTVSLKIRLGNLKRLSRQVTLHSPTQSTMCIYTATKNLLTSWFKTQTKVGVRLLGVEVSQFRKQKQLTLFDNNKDVQQDKIDQVLDTITSKYGSESIKRAPLLHMKSRFFKGSKK